MNFLSTSLSHNSLNFDKNYFHQKFISITYLYFQAQTICWNYMMSILEPLWMCAVNSTILIQSIIIKGLKNACTSVHLQDFVNRSSKKMDQDGFVNYVNEDIWYKRNLIESQQQDLGI